MGSSLVNADAVPVLIRYVLTQRCFKVCFSCFNFSELEVAVNGTILSESADADAVLVFL